MSFAPRSTAPMRAPFLGASLVAVTLLLAHPAAAQNEPTFAFGKPEEVKPQAPPVEWKVQARAGLNQTSGNSQTTNVTAGLTASRKEGNNKLALDGGINYGRSNIQVATIDTTVTPNVITALNRQEVTSTNNWFSKGRYDRFFTPNNSGYVSGQAAADRIAGKAFVGGGQLGYSRQLVKTDNNTLVAEIGYDFSYESYVEQPGKTLDPVSIHSARLFVGETAKLTSATGLTASVEAFFNLNKETKALNVRPAPRPGRRRVPRHALHQQAGRQHDAVQEPERGDQLSAPLRPEPGTAPGAVRHAGGRRLRGGLPALRGKDRHRLGGDADLHVLLGRTAV